MEDYVKLEIPAKAEFVSLGRLALFGLLRSRGGYSEDAVADLELALTGACSDSVRHAYDHDEGLVHLEFTVHSDRVTVLIQDRAAGSTRTTTTVRSAATSGTSTSPMEAWASPSTAPSSTPSTCASRTREAPSSSSPRTATSDELRRGDRSLPTGFEDAAIILKNLLTRILPASSADVASHHTTGQDVPMLMPCASAPWPRCCSTNTTARRGLSGRRQRRGCVRLTPPPPGTPPPPPSSPSGTSRWR